MKCNAGLKYINVLFLLGTLNMYFANGKGVKVKFEFRIVQRICAKKVKRISHALVRKMQCAKIVQIFLMHVLNSYSTIVIKVAK